MRRGPKSKVDRTKLLKLMMKRKSYAAVGREFSVSGERIRQICTEMGIKRVFVAPAEAQPTA